MLLHLFSLDWHFAIGAFGYVLDTVIVMQLEGLFGDFFGTVITDNRGQL